MDSTLSQRLSAKIDFRGPAQCWPYTGATQHGYGVISDGPRSLKAHRVAYELWVGPIPKGLTIDHECHNLAYANGECPGGNSCPHRACCNPSHLVIATTRENTLRGGSIPAVNSRKDTCVRGHPLGPDRHCRECESLLRAGYRAKRRSAKYPDWVPGVTCRKGHAFAEHGYTRPDGYTNCRTCAAEKARQYRQRDDSGGSSP